jgi:hypothetical protein
MQATSRKREREREREKERERERSFETISRRYVRVSELLQQLPFPSFELLKKG